MSSLFGKPSTITTRQRLHPAASVRMGGGREGDHRLVRTASHERVCTTTKQRE